MKKWIAKAIVQKAISYLPGRNSINYLFQKYVTKGVYLTDEYFTDRLEHAADHIKAYMKLGGDNTLTTTLELGTGWYPVVPIAFFLYGIEDIYTVDISMLTNKERIKTTILKFTEYEKNGRLSALPDIKSERLAELQNLLNNYENLSFTDINQRLHIKYLIHDARHLDLPDGSIDLVNSNNTFEHIYPQVLTEILKEFKRICKRGGVMSHFIDMSDHFAHFDKTISTYNFLKYSDAQWRWIDNDIQPQNRLRITDYKQMYAQLDIAIDGESSRPGNVDQLRTMALDQKYAHIPIDETAKTHCHFISKM